MTDLCHHDWVGDDECAYCRSEELEGLLSECMERIAELEADLVEARKCNDTYAEQWPLGDTLYKENKLLRAERDRLREALLNLNAAIDYHWNDSFTGVQRMPDAHAKMIVAAQQVAKQAIRKEIT